MEICIAQLGDGAGQQQPETRHCKVGIANLHSAGVPPLSRKVSHRCNRATALSGEASQNQQVQASFNMCFIVTVGWAIDPAGYFLGHLTGAVAEAPLN